MSEYTINSETELTGANVADADEMHIYDASAGATKKVTAASLRQFAQSGVVDATAATLAVTAAAHAGRVVTLNRAAGVVATLPAATGSGAKYQFIIGTTVTSNSYTVQVDSASATMCGNALLAQDSADTAVLFEAGATADTVAMNGTTTGGLKGTEITLIDIAANLWYVRVVGAATGTEATPFSAAV